MNRFNRVKFSTKFTVLDVADLFTWFFFFMTFIVTLVGNSPILFYIRFIFLSVAGLIGFLQLTKRNYVSKKIIFFVFIWTVSCLLSYLAQGLGAYPPNLFIYSFLYMGMAVNFTSHKHSTKPAEFLLYLVCITILIKFLVFKLPPSLILVDSDLYSHNFISVLVLSYVAVYSLCCIQNNVPVSYLAALLFAIISLLAYGRGGILSSFAFLFLITFLGKRDIINRNKTLIVYLIILITLLIASVLLYLFYFDFETFRLIFFRFYVSPSIENEPRLVIWGSYLSECVNSLTGFLFGVNPIPIFPPEGNLHNTFLTMHSRYGLIATLFCLYTILRLIIYSYKVKAFYLLCILAALILRAMTDKIAFHGFCEPLFYCFVFIWFNVQEKGCFIRHNGY